MILFIVNAPRRKWILEQATNSNGPPIHTKTFNSPRFVQKKAEALSEERKKAIDRNKSAKSHDQNE